MFGLAWLVAEWEHIRRNCPVPNCRICKGVMKMELKRLAKKVREART
jgi:hypothetical protein